MRSASLIRVQSQQQQHVFREGDQEEGEVEDREGLRVVQLHSCLSVLWPPDERERGQW